MHLFSLFVSLVWEMYISLLDRTFTFKPISISCTLKIRGRVLIMSSLYFEGFLGRFINWSSLLKETLLGEIAKWFEINICPCIQTWGELMLSFMVIWIVQIFVRVFIIVLRLLHCVEFVTFIGYRCVVPNLCIKIIRRSIQNTVIVPQSSRPGFSVLTL